VGGRRTGFEHFPHGADVGVRGYGRTKAEAFEQAALALVRVIADAGGVPARERVEVMCEAPDDELLLVDWLNALVFEMVMRRMVFSRFKVELDGPRLRGEAWGGPAALTPESAGVEVKGATYTALRVGQEADGTWIAQCVVDV
jgi:SHS2 domain-containing protein